MDMLFLCMHTAQPIPGERTSSPAMRVQAWDSQTELSLYKMAAATQIVQIKRKEQDTRELTREHYLKRRKHIWGVQNKWVEFNLPPLFIYSFFQPM